MRHEFLRSLPRNHFSSDYQLDVTLISDDHLGNSVFYDYILLVY